MNQVKPQVLENGRAALNLVMRCQELLGKIRVFSHF